MKPTYEELEKKCALQQSKLAAINELMSVVEKASDIAKAGIEELQSQNADMSVQLANAESKCRELAAENADKQEFIKTCFRAAAVGGSMDGADIQELGERLGLFGRETYQPVLHGYICGHEAGEDTVYVMKKTPATDAFLAEVRAQGVEALVLRRKTAARIARERDDLRAADALEGEAYRAQMFADEIRQEAK
ncbi:hypothetical protein [Citrobacter sp. RHBSTW-00029]|uniref:hypothetical protein n=1 Tax=Citrobacter sp. RHBSTW-00029 TaxID=2742631 RepID=UPI0015F8AA3E|nr:hypothetical protein [Citrobacter sp. RHBSTW-00029]MBA8105956.1 hypothetical protein [Citrobacter sp. RHBSTW-00029]